MNKFGLLLSVLLLAGTSDISAQMDASRIRNAPRLA